jgi:hypothetical protein
VIGEICKKKDGDLTLAEFVTHVHEHLDEFELKHVTDGATLVDIRHPIRVKRAPPNGPASENLLSA